MYSSESRKKTGSAADLGPGGLQFFYYRLAGFFYRLQHAICALHAGSPVFLLQTTIRPSSFYYRLQFAPPPQFLLQTTVSRSRSAGRGIPSQSMILAGLFDSLFYVHSWSHSGGHFWGRCRSRFGLKHKGNTTFLDIWEFQK